MIRRLLLTTLFIFIQPKHSISQESTSSSSETAEATSAFTSIDQIWDTTNMWCDPAPRPLKLRVPYPYLPEDTISFLHPSMAYFPDSYNGYMYWASFTLNTCGSYTKEYPFIRCSNDLITWDSFPGSPSLLMFPLSNFRTSGNITAAYSSDAFLFIESRTKLWLGARLVHGDNTITIWMTSTTDGSDWTEPRRVFEFKPDAGTGTAHIMSPAMLRTKSGSCRILAVSAGAYGRVVRLESPSPDSQWTLADTVLEHGATGMYREFPVGKSTEIQTDDSLWVGKYKPWHIDVVDVSSGEKLILLLA